MKKRFVYICSPLRGDYEKNADNARTFCRVIAKDCTFGVIPIAPHLYFPQFLNDGDPDERELGIKAGLALLETCEELWVFGIDDPSEGMRAEMERAKELGIPILDGQKILDHIIINSRRGGTTCKTNGTTPKPLESTAACKAEPSVRASRTQ